MISASASAKIILFGEHAVVYGQPAIAVPVSSKRAVATIEPASSEGNFIQALNLNDEIQPISNLAEDNPLRKIIDLILTIPQKSTPSFKISHTIRYSHCQWLRKRCCRINRYRTRTH